MSIDFILTLGKIQTNNSLNVRELIQTINLIQKTITTATSFLHSITQLVHGISTREHILI